MKKRRGGEEKKTKTPDTERGRANRKKTFFPLKSLSTLVTRNKKKKHSQEIEKEKEKIVLLLRL